MKTALVTGITGQDGAYLARHLLQLDYRVIGTYRRSATPNFWRLEAIGAIQHHNLKLQELDITDPFAVLRVIASIKPDEIYNLAAQSFVASSFTHPVSTTELTGTSALYMLEAIRVASPESRFYQASTSEMFGSVQKVPQDEDTPFYPRSPYGVSKLYAHWMTINYRESHNLFASSGILFNHESPLRGAEFVTRKITMGVARIKTGQQSNIELGNLNAQRDWGFAPEYVDGMHRILAADHPDTFILATGRTETVRRFVELAFLACDISLEWQGSGPEEKAVDMETGQVRVCINPDFYRPAEVNLLIGDPTKAREHLGWSAHTTLEKMIEVMVRADVDRAYKRFPF